MGGVEESEAETSPNDERPWWRRHVVGVVAIAGFVTLAGWGLGAWLTRPHAPDYSGQTRAVSFDFDCYNSIGWQDAKTSYLWWAGDHPAAPVDFDTAPTVPGSPPYHHSSGQLHFDNETQATYTSDAGGQLVLVRQPLHQMYVATCAVGPGGPLPGVRPRPSAGPLCP